MDDISKINNNAQHILKYCLYIFAVHANENDKKKTDPVSRAYTQAGIYHVTSIFVFVLCVCGVYHFRHDMDSIIDSFNDMILMAYSIVCSLTVISKSSDLGIVYKTLQNQLYEYKVPIVENETEIRSKYVRKAIKFVYIGAFIVFIANLSKIVLFLLFGVYQLQVNGWKEGLELPLTFACWIPFPLDNIYKYVCVYFFIALVGLWITLHFLGQSSFLVLTFMYTSHEIEILTLAIKNMKDKALMLTVGTKTEHDLKAKDYLHYEKTLLSLQKETVQHHQKIMSFITQLSNLFGTILLSFMGLIVLTLSVCAYRLSVESNLISSTSLSYFGFMFGLIGETFLFSWLGQAIIDQDTKLRSLLIFDWQGVPQSFNKGLLIMKEKENRLLCLKYGVIYILDLETFSKIIQAAYSFFSLLRSARF